jgi:alkylation response protein AidB-like acyl-CoA dehydrogenase
VANFYSDNADILFHLRHMDLGRIIDLKEDGFAEKDTHPEAPLDVDDAMDNYRRVLEIVGEIAGDFVAPRAREVDRSGARFEDGQVHYAQGTAEALARLKMADLMGFTLPRRFGGLNMPKTIYSVATEIISRADASLMNLFGLQEIADTINKFGSDDQKERFLPRFSSGEVTGAMALTEPDAGSDLQTVMLRAEASDAGEWRLNGVKRFITNGCADVSLVMARSEAGTTGGRGISLFVYERDDSLKIRRIEHKLGIHGSPTCELQFTNARAELLGKRKLGLVKYTMSLMNGARLGVAAQALGIAEAAWRESSRYAKDRIQFKKPIRSFSAVYEMLTHMKVGIEAARSLLYETARLVDIKENLEEKAERHPESARALKTDIKTHTRLAALFTPIVKAYASEMANKACYDAIQIHGGVGYTCDFDVERLYRDARITNIYEGTTQLQVLAAIGGVIAGVVSEQLAAYESRHDFSPIGALFAEARQLRADLETGIAHIKAAGDKTYQEYHARRLVEMATDCIIGYLLCIDALSAARKKQVAAIFVQQARHRVRGALDQILSEDRSIIAFQNAVLDEAAAGTADGGS